MVNVVITGGAGFLGSRLARELLAAGSLEVAGGGARPRYAGRPEAAAPATGLLRRHNQEQAKLVDEALSAG